jgi:hypothetical protein
VSSLTPTTKVASAPLAGAETMTKRGAGVEVGGGLVAVGEDAGGLDDHVDAEVAPGQIGRVALGRTLRCRRRR